MKIFRICATLGFQMFGILIYFKVIRQMIWCLTQALKTVKLTEPDFVTTYSIHVCKGKSDV